MRHAVILAGGGGTRLWPASRRAHPKQLLPLGTSDESLLAATWRRIAPLCPGGAVVVTVASQADLVLSQLPDARVLAEPTARNTAAALGLAAVHVAASDPDAVIAALPADHHVGDDEVFRDTAERAIAAAEVSGAIVTIGIVPTRAETAYGYLEVGTQSDLPWVYEVDRFVEKPDLATAEAYLAAGRYRWNAGMLFVRADVLLAAIERHMPDTFAGLAEIERALATGGAAAASAAAARIYPTLPNVSIDYGVMEKAAGVLTISGNFPWSDIGSWSALADVREPDADGNVVSAVAVLQDAERNIVVGDRELVIAVVGVHDLVIVQSGDAILVVPRARAQDVRDVVELLKRKQLDRFL